jgi:two-component system chemotaxis response regulator CheB
VLRELIAHLLESDPQLRVVGTAANGQQAIDEVQRLRPDVVTMDYHMPTVDGMEATRRIMQTQPVPIVIVSGSSAADETQAAFRLLEAGALAVVEKPRGFGGPASDPASSHLVRTVKLMAEVKVVRRWGGVRSHGAPPPLPAANPPKLTRGNARGIVIGASTGGPVVIKTILAGLPRNLPVPVLIVQHIAPGFIEGLVQWLSVATGFPVHIASHRLRPEPGHAYFAPDGHQMRLAHDGTIVLGDGAPVNGHCPSVSCLFASAQAVWGRETVAVLLTGMGRDGAQELKQLRTAGAVTFAQDEESSAVNGMPGEAVRLGAAMHVLAPKEIAEMLSGLAT